MRILIAVDGSPDSEAAIRSAIGRSWPPNAEFALVSVIDPAKSSFVGRLAPARMRRFMERADDEQDAAGRMLDSFAQPLRERDMRVTCHVRHGDPKRVLVEEAEVWRADCIFMGARGLTHLKRFFMGGVSMAVAARAHCSVEVVRVVRRRG